MRRTLWQAVGNRLHDGGGLKGRRSNATRGETTMLGRMRRRVGGSEMELHLSRSDASSRLTPRLCGSRVLYRFMGARPDSGTVAQTVEDGQLQSIKRGGIKEGGETGILLASIRVCRNEVSEKQEAQERGAPPREQKEIIFGGGNAQTVSFNPA